jgi:hypothetical protein
MWPLHTVTALSNQPNLTPGLGFINYENWRIERNLRAHHFGLADHWNPPRNLKKYGISKPEN